jgi:hypothetical protein
MAPDPFYSPKRTLSRAKHHVGDFEAKITAFAGGQYWSYSPERDSRGLAQRHKVIFDRDFFEDLGGVVFDAANNLRAVLDQSAYATAILGGVLEPKSAYFPISSDAAKLQDVIRGRCKDLRPEIISLFSGFKPYLGGSYCLARLNMLCNAQKHAELVPFRTDELLGVRFVMGGAGLVLKHHWDAENFEIEILDIPPGGDLGHPGTFAFDITFDHSEPGLGNSEPLGLLTGMAQEVERVLIATEAECRKLGLIR